MRSAYGPPTYLESLLSPELSFGAKVPDIVATPTGTFQLVADGTLSCGAAGDSVAFTVTPIVGNGSTTYPITTGNGTTAGVVSTYSNVSWISQAATVALYAGFRPVSGMAELEFIGPTSSDGGQLIGALAPNSNAYGAFSTFTSINTVPGAEIVPVRNGIRVLWKPADESNFQFVNLNGQMPSSTNIIYYPQIILAATGLPASAANTIRYHCAFNFEATPKVDTISLVQVAPSPYDPQGMRSALEWSSGFRTIFIRCSNPRPPT